MSDRVIKFRAKQTNGRGWFYGAYIPPEYASYNVGTIFNGYMRVEIDEDTLGQYTGIRDINGVDIYEGDIVECENTDPGEKFVNKIRGKVDFAEGRWSMVARNVINTKSRKLIPYPLYNLCKYGRVRVLGNATDNPELLDGDTE